MSAFSGGAAPPPAVAVDSKSLASLFDKYKDSDEDTILVEGIEQFCQDLVVDPTDIVMLVIAFHLNAENMCEFTRTGWMEGWTSLRCDTLVKMKTALPTLRKELQIPTSFKDIYHFTFTFAKTESQKSLALDIAISFWSLLLPDYPHLEQWCAYLQTEYKKSISKDTWSLFLDFTRAYKSEFKGYKEDAAWPVVIDGFVDWMKEHQEI